MGWWPPPLALKMALWWQQPMVDMVEDGRIEMFLEAGWWLSPLVLKMPPWWQQPMVVAGWSEMLLEAGW